MASGQTESFTLPSPFGTLAALPSLVRVRSLTRSLVSHLVGLTNERLASVSGHCDARVHGKMSSVGNLDGNTGRYREIMAAWPTAIDRLRFCRRAEMLFTYGDVRCPISRFSLPVRVRHWGKSSAAVNSRGDRDDVTREALPAFQPVGWSSGASTPLPYL